MQGEGGRVSPWVPLGKTLPPPRRKCPVLKPSLLPRGARVAQFAGSGGVKAGGTGADSLHPEESSQWQPRPPLRSHEALFQAQEAVGMRHALSHSRKPGETDDPMWSSRWGN